MSCAGKCGLVSSSGPLNSSGKKATPFTKPPKKPSPKRTKCCGSTRTFAEEFLALPVYAGEKTESERFPGAVTTLTIEAMMQDRKAVQAGTSHFLGQNFAKASNIRYLSREGTQEYGWTTSWGASTAPGGNRRHDSRRR